MRTPQEIAQDNDLFRTTMILTGRHKIVLTQGVMGLKAQDPTAFNELLHLVRTFKDFNQDNDPHREHDLGCVVLAGITYMWKIDYYAADWEHGADPSDGQTKLLLTIMRAEEY